jgi:hypothetical protein
MQLMFHAFDILKKLPDGGIVWIESAQDLDTARGRSKQFASYRPGEYVIFSHETQSVIAMPWVSFEREVVEAAGAGERREETKKTEEKKRARKSPAEPKTSQVIADIVADIVRTVRHREKRV